MRRRIEKWAVGLINRGPARSVRYKKNVAALVILKILSAACAVLIVPLSLNYLDETKYGIWLTINSTVAWVSFCNFGITNGLRNELGKAMAADDQGRAKTLISTTFAVMLIIFAILQVIFFLANSVLSWVAIFKAPEGMVRELNLAVLLVFMFFSMRFVTGMITTVLITDQRSAVAELYNTIGSALTLIIIYCLSKSASNSLVYMGIGMSSIPVVVPLIMCFWFFRNDYRRIAPSFSYVNFQKIRGLAGQGAQFFILQIAAIVLTMTDVIIITQLYGPEEVVPFIIAKRYFGYFLVFFGVATSPYWASCNEAYAKLDFLWIKNTTNKLFWLWGLFSLGIVVCYFLAERVYFVWIGDAVTVPMSLSFWMGLFVIAQALNSIFAIFVFSTGKVRMLTYMAVVVSILNIPVSIFFAINMSYGSAGIIMATFLCTLLNLTVGMVQYQKLVNQNGRGIWLK